MTQAATERMADTETATDETPPGWLRFLALAGATGVLGFGSVGLLLAVNGWYRPALAFPIGAVATVAVLWLAWPAIVPKKPMSRDAHVYAAIGVAAILAITAWNAQHASQHVLINRDGGSYANTARWIARDGSLDVKPRVGPFVKDRTLYFDSFGVYQMKDGTLQFQFAHLLPVVLAEAYAIKGDTGLFHAPEVLGGIALLAFFVLAWKLIRRPLFALSAMLALAFIIPQISFSRDSYSEIPSQILLFTALWLLVSPKVLPSWRAALVSGLFLGALEATRIDAIVFFIGVPVFIAVAWLRAEGSAGRRALVPAIGAFVAGLVPGIALGTIDLTRHSGKYYSDLSHNVHQLIEATVGSAILCAIVVAIASAPVVVRAVRRLPWPALAAVAGAIVACAGFFAWLIRPRIQHIRGGVVGLVGGLQGAEHVTFDPTRKYFERSLTWMSWYLGPITVAVGIVGAGFLVWALLRGRMSRVIGALAVLAPGTLLYLYKADAVPDHPWVTRRFLVGAFPVLVLLALGLAAVVSGMGSGANGRFRIARAVGSVGAIVVAIAAIAYPIHTVVNVRAMTEQRSYLSVVDEACTDLGPRPVVIVLERDAKDLFDDWVPQALRSWCGADVGVARGRAHPDAIRQLAQSWSAQGRRLFVVAVDAATVRKVIPDAAVVSTHEGINAFFLQQALTHRPDRYAAAVVLDGARAGPDRIARLVVVAERPARPLPSWFVAGLAAAIVWFATAGAVGIGLLVVGWYRAGVVGASATLAGAGTAVVAARGLGPREHADHRAALAAVGLVLAFFVLAGAFHSEHLLHDRDPAIYITTGRSIARTHQLRPKTRVEVFRDRAFGNPDSRYQPDFLPMLPVLLAMGWSIGGTTGMLLVGSVLGSFGLLACYALGVRVVGTRGALVVLVLLMISPLQLWFARDAYSELVVQVLMLGGLWLFLEARARTHWGIALISGAVVASSTLARVDALGIIAGLLAFVAIVWVRCDTEAMPPRARRTVLAFAGALVAGTLVALAATNNVAHRYITVLGAEYHQLLAAFGAAVVGLVAVVAIHRVRPGLGRRLASMRYLFPAFVAASVGVFVWTYALRPAPLRDLPVSRPGHPATGAVRQAIFAWHFSRSLHWFSAYFGLVAIVVAFVGFLVLAARARRGSAAAAAVFLVAIPTAVLYIARPSVQPGQPWAMRRYLPVVIPGLAIAVAVAVDALWRLARSTCGRRARAAAASAVIAVALLVAVPTAWAAKPFVTARMQHGAQAAIDHVCDLAGHDAALLVYGGRAFVGEFLEVLRAFCGVPVANSSTVDVSALARQWHALGRRLLVVTSAPATISKNAPGANLVGHYVIADDADPEKIYDRAPRRFVASRTELWVLEIPAIAS